MKVVVIDYDCGNLFSLIRAFERLSVSAEITSQPRDVLSADRIILPGVGAFPTGMKKLLEKGLVNTIVQCAQKKIPILGICLGMQLLFEKSFEFGEHKGLGLIPGVVKPLQPKISAKVPHVGWNAIYPIEENYELWQRSIFRDFKAGNDTYFVHSYIVHPSFENHIIGWTHYGGVRFCSAVMADSIFGCQFHPEKSGKDGLKIIENFLLV